MTVSSISISDYKYSLEENQIAKYPLASRDETRLLVFKNKLITDDYFMQLHEHIPSKSLLIFNDSRVIKARLVFKKPGGSSIEIFCLTKKDNGNGYAIWNCYIGNSKRWKSQELVLPSINGLPELKAKRSSTLNDTHLVEFSWADHFFSFEELLEHYGKVPLPPYLNREPDIQDTERYQTIYAKNNGSVAAPTAGLHFTPRVLDTLEKKQCVLEQVTLHVGAGTFKPVTSSDVIEHSMHEEKIIISKSTIVRIIQSLHETIVPVGTTSMRSLESLYWIGYQLLTKDDSDLIKKGFFNIEQWEPYKTTKSISAFDSLQAILSFMESRKLDEISGFTRIIIVPGYSFKICNALITNFHQPQSTLLLLVAAFIGNNWQNVYKHALNHDYRFLSYGDSCLFFPHPQNNGAE